MVDKPNGDSYEIPQDRDYREKLEKRRWKRRAILLSLMLVALATLLYGIPHIGSKLAGYQDKIAGLEADTVAKAQAIRNTTELLTKAGTQLDEVEVQVATLTSVSEGLRDKVKELEGKNEDLRNRPPDTVKVIVTEFIPFPDRTKDYVLDEPLYKGQAFLTIPGDPEKEIVLITKIELKPISVNYVIECNRETNMVQLQLAAEGVKLIQQDSVIDPRTCSPHGWLELQTSDAVWATSAATIASFFTFWWWEVR